MRQTQTRKRLQCLRRSLPIGLNVPARSETCTLANWRIGGVPDHPPVLLRSPGYRTGEPRFTRTEIHQNARWIQARWRVCELDRRLNHSWHFYRAQKISYSLAKIILTANKMSKSYHRARYRFSYQRSTVDATRNASRRPTRRIFGAPSSRVQTNAARS